MTFSAGRPPQLVIGNGGVVLDSLAEGAADGLTATIDGQGADVLSERRFGYLVLERDPRSDCLWRRKGRGKL